MTTQNSEPILRVEDLTVVYEPIGAPVTRAVDDVSLEIRRGEFVGLVGESGSGKSTLGFAITKLAKAPARIEHGRIVFEGRDIAPLGPEELRSQRQGGFAMVLQSGMNALNPVRSIRNHFLDIFRAHGHVAATERLARARDLLSKVELDPEVLDRFPSELSGGMRQRVSIALALSLEPSLMVFDEPTTALDMLVQHAVMGTIRDLQRSEGFTAILISHDLGTVLEATERVLVMHDGRIVEDSPSARILSDPQHEYTKMLLSHYANPRAEVVSLPGLEERPVVPAEGSDTRALVVEGLTKTYRGRRGRTVQAVDDVSFRLEPGGALALVGQSGSGKSTIAKMLTGVERPTSGSILFGDQRVDQLKRREMRGFWSDVQMVFQDPYAALNPLHTVGYHLERPVANLTDLSGADVRRRVIELLETVGLTPAEEFAAKLPHQLSGGQRQRVVIARALACDPQVIVADEPVSMLDVSLRAGVLRLLRDLREERGVSLLYITHDLLSARLITDDILVLHDGRVVESGRTADVMRSPRDPYTVDLLDAIPDPARAQAA
ncbi:ABC transporter ATP-binding protein [Microbacterium indicum]|uniref:ABC transporter ATP-binding protein n=1 Tax=Microbacterium indicum TaxID=358100 RepID=UPI0004285800|nr:ABC transporter ATP-binding protein [Microbacterium indicum]